jgi:hypothetical protein
MSHILSEVSLMVSAMHSSLARSRETSYRRSGSKGSSTTTRVPTAAVHVGYKLLASIDSQVIILV